MYFDVKRFGFNNLHQDFNIMRNVVHIMMDSCRDKKNKKVFIFTDCLEVIHIKCCIRMYLVFVFRQGQYGSEYGSTFFIYKYIYVYMIRGKIQGVGVSNFSAQCQRLSTYN